MSDEASAFWAGVILTLIPLVFLFGWFGSMADDSWRHQIADHGCAEFYLDQNHERQWNWKSESKKVMEEITVEPLEKK